MSTTLTYGVHGLDDVGSDALLNDLGADRVRNVIEVNVNAHNAAMNAMLGVFAEPTVAYSERYILPGGGELESGDENSKGTPRIGSQYDVGYPIAMGLYRWDANWVTLQKMSVKRFATTMTDAFNNDIAWVRRKLLTALLKNTSTSVTDPEYGAITVYPLANSDSVKYPFTAGQTTLSTDSHYYAEADAIADNANPYPILSEELLEHPDNRGAMLAFVPTNLVTTTKNLTEFIPAADMNFRPGSATPTLSGNPAGAYPGEVIGYLSESKAWAIHWRALPSYYIVGVAENGPRPLKYREDVQESLRGFRQQGEINTFPYFGSVWARRIGFGSSNRVGAVVGFVGSSDSYAIPTGYSTPLA